MNLPSSHSTTERRSLAKGSACEACRLRKIRCGAEKPSCVKCSKHGRQCDYPPPKPPTHTPRSTPRSRPPQQQASADTARYTPYPSTRPLTASHPVQTFQPSTGAESDQQPPAAWDELDFSWLLDLSEVDEENTQQQEFDEAMQQHCLWLFFTNEYGSGLEMNIARFYDRLAAVDPADKPHPALLGAMNLIICRASPLDFVRQREATFFDEAEAALDKAIKDITTLPRNMLDLMRASTLLAEWLWAQAREGEAVIMTSKACRFALAACYDQIPSSTTLLARSCSPLLRGRRPLGPPPQDHVELAEMIYAFWSVVMLDLASAIATGQPAHITLDAVKTPLPKPWAEYGDANPRQDHFLYDLSTESTDKPQTDFAYIIQSTVLLHFATLQSMAVFDKPHKPILSPLPTTPDPFPSAADRSSLTATVERFTRNLPPHLKSIHTPQDGQAKSTAAITLHFLIASTRMYLCDTNDFEVPNDAAMYHVRRIVDLVRLLSAEDIASMSLFIYVVWVLAGQLLIREAKRLTVLGETFAAMPLQADVQLLANILAIVGQQSPLVATEIRDLEQIISLPLGGDVAHRPAEPREDVSQSNSSS